MKKSVLITAVGGDIGQGVIKCLKETGYNYNLIGCDIDKYAAGAKLVDKFYLSPMVSNENAYLEFLKNIVKVNKIDYILPINEREIDLLSRNNQLFAGDCVNIFMHKPDVLNIFLDKQKTMQFMKDNGLNYIETYKLDDYSDGLNYPLIIKPRTGFGGKGIKIANDRDELLFYKKRLKDFIVQEYIGDDNNEFTVGVFAGKGNIYTIAFKRKLGYGSLTKVAILTNNPEIEGIAKKIAKRLNLEGSLNIQFRLTDAGYIPFEVNPRFSSTVHFRSFFGFTDVKWWIDIFEGKEIEYIQKYKEGVGVRTVGECFFDLKIT